MHAEEEEKEDEGEYISLSPPLSPRGKEDSAPATASAASKAPLRALNVPSRSEQELSDGSPNTPGSGREPPRKSTGMKKELEDLHPLVFKELNLDAALTREAEHYGRPVTMKIDRWGEIVAEDIVEMGKDSATRAKLKERARRKKKARDLIQRDNLRELQWVSMVVNWSSFLRKHKALLKKRIRKGIPDSLRGLVWPHICGSVNAKVKKPSLYSKLIRRTIRPEDDLQIRKDLPRSYQTHVLFKSPEPGSRDVVGEGQQSLYNVLKAYSIYHSKVGYCQGMASLAGMCLMYLNDEEAFWMLEVLLAGFGDRIGVKGLYTEGMPLAFEFMHIHQCLLKKLCPKLNAHFEANGVFPTTYAFRWLTTRFDSFPRALYIRIFDIFLLEGMKIVFRVALWLLISRQKKLLKEDFEGITVILSDLPNEPDINDPDYVIEQSLKVPLTNAQIKKYHKEYQKAKQVVDGVIPTY